MTTTLKNKVLAQAEDKLESQLVPQTRDAYLKIVVHGMKVGLDGGRDSILAGIVLKSQDPLKDAAVGAINLVSLMQKHAGGTLPVNAMIPAAMTLMLQALDFAEQAKVVTIDAAALAKATHFFTNYFFTVSKISPAMLNKMGARVHQIMGDPTAMEKISRRTGLVKDPGASSPSGIINEAMPATEEAAPASGAQVPPGAA